MKLTEQEADRLDQAVYSKQYLNILILNNTGPQFWKLAIKNSKFILSVDKQCIYSMKI